MKRFPSFFIFMSVLILVSILPVKPSIAQETSKQDKIAVVDVEYVLRSALVVKNIGEQITKYREQYQLDINNEEKELRDSQMELKRQEAILSVEAFEENRNKFAKRVSEVQAKVQRRKQGLAKTQAEAMRKVELALNGILDKLVAERGIHLVINKVSVIFLSERLDVSKVILERLNKEMVTLAITDPEK